MNLVDGHASDRELRSVARSHVVKAIVAMAKAIKAADHFRRHTRHAFRCYCDGYWMCVSRNCNDYRHANGVPRPDHYGYAVDASPVAWAIVRAFDTLRDNPTLADLT